jgi:hypothetical protein
VCRWEGLQRRSGGSNDGGLHTLEHSNQGTRGAHGGGVGNRWHWESRAGGKRDAREHLSGSSRRRQCAVVLRRRVKPRQSARA